MARFIEQLRDDIPYDIFTDTEVKNAFAGSAHSRYGLIKREITRGSIIHLRRGLYGFGKRYQKSRLKTYEVAQKIYGPSYVSFESALSYHGLIPEGVPTTTSACLKRSHEFVTPLGIFSYTRIPWFNFIGVQRIEENQSSFFIADSAKALVDYVSVHKKDWYNAKPLIESLRIDHDDLINLPKETLLGLSETYKSRRARRFIEGLLKDLNL